MPALVTEISTTVEDLDDSTRFCTEVLGAKVVDTRDFSGTELDAQLGTMGAHARVRRLDLGSERLNLMQFLEPASNPPRREAKRNDLDFQHIALVVRDIERVHAAILLEETMPIRFPPTAMPGQYLCACPWDEGQGLQVAAS